MSVESGEIHTATPASVVEARRNALGIASHPPTTPVSMTVPTVDPPFAPKETLVDTSANEDVRTAPTVDGTAICDTPTDAPPPTNTHETVRVIAADASIDAMEVAKDAPAHPEEPIVHETAKEAPELPEEPIVHEMADTVDVGAPPLQNIAADAVAPKDAAPSTLENVEARDDTDTLDELLATLRETHDLQPIYTKTRSETHARRIPESVKSPNADAQPDANVHRLSRTLHRNGTIAAACAAPLRLPLPPFPVPRPPVEPPPFSVTRLPVEPPPIRVYRREATQMLLRMVAAGARLSEAIVTGMETPGCFVTFCEASTGVNAFVQDVMAGRAYIP